MLGVAAVPIATWATPPTCSKAPDAFQTRNELTPGSLQNTAQELLNFVQISDVHALDDDGALVIGGSVLDPAISRVSTAQRMQDEYTDEVLNAMVGTINACHAADPIEFMISTGDNTDLGLVNEVRRLIDNIDGTFDRPTAYEAKCLASLGPLAFLQSHLCKIPTGRGLADTQTVDPDPNNIVYQVTATRGVQQYLDTLTAVLTGRNASGGTNVARQTFDKAPGLPAALRCNAGSPGCANIRLGIPWYVVFGNHDGTLRGTVPFEPGFQVTAAGFGRHFMQYQHEFIDEFFKTTPLPGPVGHGFNEADAARKADVDERNDGYYAFDWPQSAPLFRMIVLNTLIDGVEGGLELGYADAVRPGRSPQPVRTRERRDRSRAVRMAERRARRGGSRRHPRARVLPPS